MASHGRLTAAQEVLVAAANIYDETGNDFTEWDLSVASWVLNRNRFGCRGYEDQYPDHKRVMAEILGTTKKDNPVRHGWLRKVRPNHYEITSLGLAEARRLRSSANGGIEDSSPRAAQELYDALQPYIFSETFREWLVDEEASVNWIKTQVFIRLRHINATALEDSLRSLRSAVKLGLEHLNATEQRGFRRGSEGGGKFISREEIERLPMFLDHLEEKFKPQMDAIRARG